MITIDITLVLHIINMIVLMFVLNAVLYKPVLGILEQRKEKIASLHGDIERFRQDARQRQAEVEEQMREASSRAKKALDGARSEAQAAGSEKLAAIRSEMDEGKEQQLAEIRVQVDTAGKQLQGNVAGFAREMAEKILGRSLEA
ncbi:MAG: hypothetical protein CSA34_06885 [Desulfobulbus propionicus]|nr:MAG: hypothetical protein CSA34_06885 [Desulfobulbus propionicus]